MTQTDSSETKKSHFRMLQSDVFLIKSALSIDDQIELCQLAHDLKIFDIKNICRNEKARQIHMQCLEGSQIPTKIANIAGQLLTELHETFPGPTTSFISNKSEANQCMLNFYPTSRSRLGWHDEREDSGIVVSMSLGDKGVFAFAKTWPHVKMKTGIKRIILESGDILIFGGRARGIVHAVESIEENSAPALVAQAMKLAHGDSITGRLNFNLRIAVSQ